MYVNPSAPISITSTLSWIERTLLGTVATAVAIVAIASVGFLMLTGRIDVRRAVQVILGCFIISGASTIARGIESAIFDSNRGDFDQPQQPALPPPLPISPSQA